MCAKLDVQGTYVFVRVWVWVWHTVCYESECLYLPLELLILSISAISRCLCLPFTFFLYLFAMLLCHFHVEDYTQFPVVTVTLFTCKRTDNTNHLFSSQNCYNEHVRTYTERKHIPTRRCWHCIRVRNSYGNIHKERMRIKRKKWKFLAICVQDAYVRYNPNSPTIKHATLTISFAFETFFLSLIFISFIFLHVFFHILMVNLPHSLAHARTKSESDSHVRL